MKLSGAMLILALLLVLSPAADARQVNERFTYIIKKGDTLWGVSERFLKDPFYWPNLWSHNPDIPNPHFIYPGQKIAIYDGRIEILPGKPQEREEAKPFIPGAPAETALPREEVMVKTLGGPEGFITEGELEYAGTLVDTVDNRIMIGEGETVFLEMKNLSDVRPGDLFTLFEIDGLVEHPVTGEAIGHRIVDLGSVRITGISAEVATGVIVRSNREIHRGARIFDHRPPLLEVSMKKSERNLSGYLVAAPRDRIVLGQYDVIFVDLGSEDRLEPGNLLYVSRPRKATEQAENPDLKLPDVLLGHAVVLETRPHTASALLLKSVGPIYRGDRISTFKD